MTDRRLPVRLHVIPVPVKGSDVASAELPRWFVPVWAFLDYVAYFFHAFVCYSRILGERRAVRLVHAHYVFPEGFFGLLLARLLRVPLVISAVGQDVNEQMRNSALLRTLCCLLLRRAYRIIAVSKPLETQLRCWGVLNTTYIPNSVDYSSIQPAQQSTSSNSVLFVGRMIHRKRPLLLLRAFERVIREAPTVRLLMCGDGPLRHALEQEVEKEGLRSNVRFFPNASAQVLSNLLSEPGVFVLPSASEGLSLALLEAMAAGKTIVASRNESHSAVLQHGKNALLFEVDNLEDLTRQILVALTDPEVRSRLGASARRLCESQFSNKAIALQLEDLYLQIAARSHGKKIQPSASMATLSVVNGPRTDLAEA